MAGEYAEGAEDDFDGDDVDDDLAPVEDGTSKFFCKTLNLTFVPIDERLISLTDVTRRTITLIKRKTHQREEGQENNAEAQLETGEAEPEDEETALRPSADNLPVNTISATTGRRATAITPSSGRRIAAALPSSRRVTRARRLPAWYKDYDTDYIATGEEEEYASGRETSAQSRIPVGVAITDPNAVASIGGEDSIPTEEWNIVVYDDEEPIERPSTTTTGGDQDASA